MNAVSFISWNRRFRFETSMKVRVQSVNESCLVDFPRGKQTVRIGSSEYTEKNQAVNL